MPSAERKVHPPGGCLQCSLFKEGTQPRKESGDRCHVSGLRWCQDLGTAMREKQAWAWGSKGAAEGRVGKSGDSRVEKNQGSRICD